VTFAPVAVDRDEETGGVSTFSSDQVHITIRGHVPHEAVGYATEKVARTARLARDPVLHAEVTLTAEEDPARERPAVAQATLDVDGRPVRAHVAATEMLEAIDLLEDRLGQRLRRHEERLHLKGGARHRTGSHDDGEWRHGDLPTQRPEHYPLPRDERQLVRTKTFALSPMSIDEAAYDLDMSGHDFYLFTLPETGTDAVLHYRSDGRLGLQLPDGVDARAAVEQVVTSAAPTLSIEDAIERLEAGDEPFVFFIRPDTGRGQVVYRRYDGNWGLITSQG
jgi:ribosomal subunit interface protein